MDHFTMEVKNINIIKICGKCKLEKQFTESGKICIDCKKEYDKVYVENNIHSILEKQRVYNSRTKDQKREYDKQYREINKDKRLLQKKDRKASGKSYIEARRSMLKAKYNITLEQYDKILSLQQNKCKICGSEKSNHKGSKLLFVDHNHTTGEIRGLLCHNCNAAIGLFKENIEVIKKAIEYLS